MRDEQLFQYLRGFLTDERKNRFEEVLNQRTNYLTVVVEDVFQMHNTSAVIRSCDAFGIQQFYAIEDRFGSQLDKNIAMGAEKWVDVHRFSDREKCVETLRNKGYMLLATSPEVPPEYGGKKPIFDLHDYELSHPTAILFGTERDGLSPELLSAADQYLRIPMMGFTESFNISVAAALVLQSLSFQLRQTRLPWPLSDSEKERLRWLWTKKSIKEVEAIIERYYKK